MTTVKYRIGDQGWPLVLGPHVVGVPGQQGDQGIVGPVGAVAPLSNGSRNRIMNGDFSVNQRGFTSTTVSGTIGFDRWYCAYHTGTGTYQAITATTGELPESAPRYIRITTTGQSSEGDQAANVQLFQRIEGVRTLSGKTVTASFWAKANVLNTVLSVQFTQAFGTGGTPSANVFPILGTVNVGTTWARYSITGTLPSIAGKTIGTAGDDRLSFVIMTSSGAGQANGVPIQNNVVELWGIQLEEGPVATTFEQKSYAAELRACQRYYQKWQQPPMKGVTGVTSVGRMAMMLPVPMRAAPALTITGTLNVYDGAASGNITTVSGIYNTPYEIEFDSAVNFTWPAQSRTASIYQNGVGYLELNAEL